MNKKGKNLFVYLYCTANVMTQGSPNQAKWATSLPWFQWNRSISVKKQSFSRPVSFFKSVFFSPIIILFLQYSHKISWNLTHTGFDVQYFISNSLTASFLRSLCSSGSGERNVKIWINFRKSPRFSLTSPLSQEREKSSYPVFTMCGEPCTPTFTHHHPWKL